MAGRRLSSNDVSVVIALAIVVLALLLIFIVERRAGRADESDMAAAVGPRAEAGASAASPLAAVPSGDAPVASASASCAAVTVQPVSGETEDGLAARQRDEAVQAILAALDAHPEPRARAAGLYFRTARDRLEGRVGDICKERPDECAASEQRQRDARGSAEALARLAVDSADAQVYVWAYRSCAAVARETAGSCQLINALQWARLDPGNAEPWFAVARGARSRRDGAGVDDAMFHVAAASVHDAGWGRLVEEMVKAASQEDRMLVGTWLASADAMSYETLDLAVPDLSRYCDARALANANRRDTCDKIAATLVDRSTMLLGRSTGIGLAKKLDWPAARLAAAELERDAANALASRDAPQFGEPTTCANVRNDLSRLIDNARLGEVEAMKQRIAATGEPIDALAAEQRRFIGSVREANAAAAAASAASAARGT